MLNDAFNGIRVVQIVPQYPVARTSPGFAPTSTRIFAARMKVAFLKYDGPRRTSELLGLAMVRHGDSGRWLIWQSTSKRILFGVAESVKTQALGGREG